MNYSKGFEEFVERNLAGAKISESLRNILRQAFLAGAEEASKRLATLQEDAFLDRHLGGAESAAEIHLRRVVLVDASRQLRPDGLSRYRD